MLFEELDVLRSMVSIHGKNGIQNDLNNFISQLFLYEGINRRLSGIADS